MEVVLGLFGFLALIVVAFVFYLLPTLMAYKRKHHSRLAIAIVNLFFGWSLIGWFFALVWSATGNIEKVIDK